MKIVIWTGGALETWGWDSLLEGGIGGSETAAAKIAHHLARRGHEVEIWGRVRPSTCMAVGSTGRVCFVPANPSQVAPEIDCDVFVSSREVAALDLGPQAALKVLWLHDAYCEDGLGGYLEKYDLILVLSKWARRAFMNQCPDVDAERIVVTRNGIEPELFLQEGETLDTLRPVDKPGARAYRFIYSSSPDRGLRRLLQMWPQLRERVPGAQLGIFYGTNNIRAAVRNESPIAQLATLAMADYLDHHVGEMEALGVHYFGRVGQGELARSFLESALWLYPTRFCETFCITALEAQAAGAYPIVTPVGALPETVRRGKFVAGPTELDYEQRFVDAVADAVGPGAAEIRAAAALSRREVLRTCSWASVAAEWEDLFLTKLGGAS